MGGTCAVREEPGKQKTRSCRTQELAPGGSAEKLKARSLFIVARDDASGDGPRLPGIRAQYEKAPEPKELIIVDGSAHAQFLFGTDQGEKVMREILRFLSAK